MYGREASTERLLSATGCPRVLSLSQCGTQGHQGTYYFTVLVYWTLRYKLLLYYLYIGHKGNYNFTSCIMYIGHKGTLLVRNIIVQTHDAN